MSDPGLNYRLKQRSRRSGLAVGLTMALTLMVCLGGFTIIYAQLEPVVSDFVSSGTNPTATSAATKDVAQARPTTETTQPAVEQLKPTAAPTPSATTPTKPTATPKAFKPDYQVDSARSVNLRSGPGVNSYDVVTAVPMDAPLMYMNEQKKTADPAGDGLTDGQVWMKFRTEDGDEGWIREVDVTKYTP